MNKLKMNIAIKLDLLLVLFWLAVYFVFHFLAVAINPLVMLVAGLGTILFVHLSITRKILRPLQTFIEIADKVADGDVNEG
ncbi:MAG: hypothetical protein PHD82_00905, partial [Candidatus Riflebacteria bacterium]|nr:hypothetical protein [Candidatus Riflebacteria bacterium]